MVQKKMWHEEDDTLQKEIEQNREDWEELDLENFKGIHHIHNGELPDGPLDQGRNCPFCAGRLRLKEVTENGYVYLYCNKCGREVFAEDIDKQDEITDKLYRTIPQSVMNYWQAYSEERQKNKAKK